MPYPPRVPSSLVPVDHLRSTLFWPLTLDLPPVADDRANRRRGSQPIEMTRHVDEQVARLCGTRWEYVHDTLEHIPRPKDDSKVEQAELDAEYDRAAYAEFTFFHDFIQRSQFSKPHDTQDAKMAPFRLFRRSDIGFLDITLQGRGGNGERHFRLDVERVNLYVYRTGVAILALEVSTTTFPGCCETPNNGEFAKETLRQLKLDDVLDLNDRIRRAHAPFLLPDPVCSAADFIADCPPANMVVLRYAWRGKKTEAEEAGTLLATYDTRDDVMKNGGKTHPLRQRLRAMGKHEREIPPFEALRWLVECDTPGKEDACGWNIAPAMSKNITWRHVADERLPILSSVTLTDERAYRDIDRGNWMRLCFVDKAGQDRFPYASEFVDTTWKEHVYDRYHYPEPKNADEPESTDAPARFLMSGYSFLAVSYGWFFENHIRMHMRRHYYQLMLLAQAELAVMLSFSSRITLSVCDFEEAQAKSRRNDVDAEECLSRDLQSIERDFLHYVHRFRFTGVSGQLQPAEMFEKLRKAMKLNLIYNDIKDELTTATGFLHARAEHRMALAGERLNVIAAIGVVAGLGMAFLGMQVLTTPDFLDGMGLVSKTQGVVEHIAFLLTVSCAFSGLGLALSHWFNNGQYVSPIAQKLRTMLWATFLFSLIIGLLFWAVGREKRLHYKDDIQQVQICEIRDGKRWCAIKSQEESLQPAR